MRGGSDHRMRKEGSDLVVEIGRIDPGAGIGGGDRQVMIGRIEGIDPVAEIEGIDPGAGIGGIDHEAGIGGIDPEVGRIEGGIRIGGGVGRDDSHVFWSLVL